MSSPKESLAQQETLVIANSQSILSGGATFTGTTFYVGGYSNIVGFVFSNVASATNGLVIEQAADTADFSTGRLTRSRYTYAAGDVDTNSFEVEIVAPFVRITYTNGGSVQSSFRLWAVARLVRGA